MRKEVLPEQFNYNKFPGPSFLHFGDMVKSEDGAIHFKLVQNNKDAFNSETFGQRFSEILLKYDYLVGDWASDQLRIKGFFRDNHNVRRSSRLSRIDDYLKEYCAFGCAYFILENEQPVEIAFEEEKVSKRKRSRKRKSTKVTTTNPTSQKETEKSRKVTSSKNNSKRSELSNDNEHFSSRKRRPKTQSQKQKRDNPAKASDKAGGQHQHFTIRKKS
ncbi:YutD-like domain-containing protein [Streptococcus halotolerans]|uniref:YutD family protein n=1 Tax=Streptococcus halotolerans TaxID=1814128 RepID=UPI0009ED0BB6